MQSYHFYLERIFPPIRYKMYARVWAHMHAHVCDQSTYLASSSGSAQCPKRQGPVMAFAQRPPATWSQCYPFRSLIEISCLKTPRICLNKQTLLLRKSAPRKNLDWNPSPSNSSFLLHGVFIDWLMWGSIWSYQPFTCNLKWHCSSKSDGPLNMEAFPRIYSKVSLLNPRAFALSSCHTSFSKTIAEGTAVINHVHLFGRKESLIAIKALGK